MFVLFTGILSGCSDDNGQVPYPDRKELELHAFSEKAASGMSFSDTVFFAKGIASGRYTEIWKAGVKADGRTSLMQPKYYPSDGSRIYLRGFAPEGKLTDDGRIAWSVDGSRDLLASGEQNGCLTDLFWQEKKSFGFIHLLTQLRFRLRLGNRAAPVSPDGYKLRLLAVDSLQREAVLSLTDRTLSFRGDKGRLIACDRPADAPLPLDTAWTELPGVMMIQPSVPVFLAVAVEDDRGRLVHYEQLPVMFHETDNRSVPGVSYLLSVTLHMQGTAVLSASVVEWQKGSNGVGTVF